MKWINKKDAKIDQTCSPSKGDFKKAEYQQKRKRKIIGYPYGEYLKKIRFLYQLTNKDLAEFLGMSVMRCKGLLHSGVRPTKDELTLIHKKLEEKGVKIKKKKITF